MSIIGKEAESSILEKFGSSIVEIEPAGNEGGEGQGDGGEGGEGSGGDGDNTGDEGQGNNTTTTTTTTTAADDNNSSGDDLSTPLAILAQEYGLASDDEILKDLDLEDDSLDGIKTFYTRREEKVKTEAINELFEIVPEVKDLVTHLQNGGSIETWKEVKQAEAINVEFEETDVDGKSKFLIEIYKQRGISEKAAKRAVEALIDDNELNDEVKAEAEKFKQTKLAEATAKANAEAVELENTRKQNEQIVSQVNGIIKQGKLSHAVIPDTERKSFNEFVLNGDALNSKYEKLTLDQRLFIDYLVYKDFKVGTLVKAAPQAPDNNKPRVRIKSDVNNGGKGGAQELTLDDLRKMKKAY
jgi:hypothetical protein